MMEEKQVERVYIMMEDGKIVAFRFVVWDDIAEQESSVVIPFRGD